MRSSVVAVALAALCAGVVSVQAFDDSKYPDWSGDGDWARLPNGIRASRRVADRKRP